MKQIFMCNYAAAAGADEYNFDNSELSQCENDIQPMSIGSPTKGRVIADTGIYASPYPVAGEYYGYLLTLHMFRL